MGDGSKCPGICSQGTCGQDEMWCDIGVDANGCWMGSWCMPNPNGDAVCPPQTGPNNPTTCPEVAPAECGEGESQCWGGMDGNECPMPDYCIPSMVGECWNMCPMNCGATDLY